jgi:hypothetical protein
MWAIKVRNAVATGADWLMATRAWLFVVRMFVHARVWLHRLTRDEGLAQRNHRVGHAHAHGNCKHDAELGPHAHGRDEPTKYGFFCAISVAFAFAWLFYLLLGGAYVLVHGELPPQVSSGINTLMYSRLLHARHDPLPPPDPLADEPTVAPRGPYPGFSVRTVANYTEMPAVVREPCRRLSKLELQEGITTEGYVMPLVLMRMCELVHETFGCENEGFLIPKLINTPDDLNICVLTFKESDGVCQHYVNPVMRPVLSSKKWIVGIESPLFPSLVFPFPYYATYLLSYQPIIEAQADQAAVPEDPAATRALSDAYDALPSPDDSVWLATIPDPQTITLRLPRALQYAIAVSHLLGETPPETPPEIPVT